MKQQQPPVPTISRPSDDTIRAYEQTDYFAEDQPPVCLRIGDAAAVHLAWLDRHAAHSASILTAWNPFGQELARAENDALQARLQTTILHCGLNWLPARGEDPKGSWQPEPGFCVFDMPPDLLDEWLMLFRQNAAVRLERGTGCRLVWHPEIARMLAKG